MKKVMEQLPKHRQGQVAALFLKHLDAGSWITGFRQIRLTSTIPKDTIHNVRPFPETKPDWEGGMICG